MTKRDHEVFWKEKKHPSEIKKVRPDATISPNGTGRRIVRRKPKKRQVGNQKDNG